MCRAGVGALEGMASPMARLVRYGVASLNPQVHGFLVEIVSHPYPNLWTI